MEVTDRYPAKNFRVFTYSSRMVQTWRLFGALAFRNRSEGVHISHPDSVIVRRETEGEKGIFTSYIAQGRP
jgi:hypothetical protein